MTMLHPPPKKRCKAIHKTVRYLLQDDFILLVLYIIIFILFLTYTYTYIYVYINTLFSL